MAIWQTHPTPAQLNEHSRQTLAGFLGIEFEEIGEDYLTARMPVDQRTIQPDGILHGGASVALAETLGSVAATLCVDRHRKRCVGLEINANHLRPVMGGYVHGVAKAIHLGRTTQVWEIRISTTEGKLVCISRHTVAVLDR